jgi:predicted nucleic acid-binding protein
MFPAVLDTSVLWPSLQRDFLLSLAIEGLYRPVWSAVILEELEHHEATKLVRRHGLAPADAERRARHLLEQMRTSFADAVVSGWEPLEGTFGLPDPDDEHVVAAAVLGGAGVIVTHNLKDFPAERLPGSLQAVGPREFAHTTVSLDPSRSLLAVQSIADRSSRPHRSVLDLLLSLETRFDMAEAVALLRRQLETRRRGQ